MRGSLPARLTTTGGRHRFLVENLPPPSIGDNEDTEVQLSDPDAPLEAVFRVTTSLQQPGVVDVEAGTYSVLNTNRGAIQVEGCPDVALSDVQPAAPETVLPRPESPEPRAPDPGTSEPGTGGLP